MTRYRIVAALVVSTAAGFTAVWWWGRRRGRKQLEAAHATGRVAR